MKCFYVESDESSAIYVHNAKKNDYKLLCIIDPGAAKNANHLWPDSATTEGIGEWQTNSTVKRVELKKICLCRLSKANASVA